MAGQNFRDFLIPADAPRLVEARGLDPFRYAEPIKATPKAQGLLAMWRDLHARPFVGVTNDGAVEHGLFPLADEGFPVEQAVDAAQALLAGLRDGDRDRLCYPIDAPEWRDWYNPEFPVNDNGLRLDDASAATRAAVMAVLRACLSDEGYTKVTRCRSANLYLGELYDLRNIMNEWSYHFLLFGTPSATEPWGWNLYGHHIGLNCLVLGRQVVVTPTFLGAEPTIVDRGPADRFTLFEREAVGGLELMRSLPSGVRERAVTYERMKDPAMPPGRWQFADERQLGGAYQDNRVVPREGVSVAEFSPAARGALVDVVASFVEHVPDGPRAALLDRVEGALDRTWWSWIGTYEDGDPFYYRVQSPVIMVEYDNHSGVWLTNPDPATFHVHTIVRTPNGNDYGKDLLRQHYAREHAPSRPARQGR